MSVLAELPRQSLQRFDEWRRQAARESDLFRFADPVLDISTVGTARYPGAPDGVPDGEPETKLLHVSRLRRRAERTGVAPCV